MICRDKARFAATMPRFTSRLQTISSIVLKAVAEKLKAEPTLPKSQYLRAPLVPQLAMVWAKAPTVTQGFAHLQVKSFFWRLAHNAALTMAHTVALRLDQE